MKNRLHKINPIHALTENAADRTTRLVHALAQWGNALLHVSPDDEAAYLHAYHKNNWFTRANVDLAVANIAREFLDEEKLTAFARHYGLFDRLPQPQTVGLVFAGNVPLVGFHDWLCVLLCGHRAMVKLSSKDDVLFPHLLKKLYAFAPELQVQTIFVEQLKNFDKVIATGSNNSSRYFEYYFGKYPHVIRKNRGSVAVVNACTTPEELERLADDVFNYFGLGCRNVSKVFLQRGMNIETVLQHFNKYADAIHHHKYKNNFDYRYTVMLMNKQTHATNGYLLAVENEAVSSPLAILHYEYFDNDADLEHKLRMQADDIQLVVGKGYSAFGSSQSPSLTDFADGVDVMEFLLA